MTTDFVIGAGVQTRLAIQSPIDLSDVEHLAWIVKQKDGAVVMTKATVRGMTILDRPAGEFEIEIVPNDTQHLAGLFRHEAKAQFADHRTQVLVAGRIGIVGRRSRRPKLGHEAATRCF